MPASILDVPERFRRCDRLELRSGIGVDQLRRFGSARGVESDGEPILDAIGAEPGATAADRVRSVRIALQNESGSA